MASLRRLRLALLLCAGSCALACGAPGRAPASCIPRRPRAPRAVVIGADGADLGFTSIALGGRAGPVIGTRYTRAGASQGEQRSHGFFFRDDADGNGVVGLPVRRAGAPDYAQRVERSASVLYLRSDGLRLSELGTLSATPTPTASTDDRCRTSCIDWYGNARPLFLKSRVFALLGYELVEGKLAGGKLAVDRRVSFAPR